MAKREVTERVQEIGKDNKGFSSTGASATARRIREAGTTKYEAMVSGGYMNMTAEEAKILGKNLQEAAEVAWKLEDEMRREDGAEAHAVSGLRKKP